MPHTIAITTAQNVNIDYEVANLGDRILGFIIDMVIKIAYLLLGALLFVPFLDDMSYQLAMIIGFLFALPIVLYSLIFEVFNNGQTPGKRLLKMKVVSLDGDEVSFSGYFLRWLFRIVDINMLSGIIAVLAIAFSEKGQRVGDIVANTSVISLKNKSNLRNTAFLQLEDEYTPIYPSVINLRNEDIMIIKEVLKKRSEDAFHLRTKLAEKIEQVIGVSKYGSSEEFLKQVISDYNYFEQSE
ncbi:RDD family protein [Portibacter lacus]|uniref:Transporter n=1 Tax=Portibacter lacus TaxID=1099794 RepID=A0AA37SPZ3_9BACT|nr:RDD family protein [Portibacter lacus]GLR16638.1 transporter [Portibacter lacus]